MPSARRRWRLALESVWRRAPRFGTSQTLCHAHAAAKAGAASASSTMPTTPTRLRCKRRWRRWRPIGGRGKKIAVLGDMFELGQAQRQRASPDWARSPPKRRIDRLYLLGDQAGAVRRGALSAGMRAHQMIIGNDHGDVAPTACANRSKRGDWLLFKGSRGMKMEKVLEALQARKGIGVSACFIYLFTSALDQLLRLQCLSLHHLSRGDGGVVGAADFVSARAPG